MSDAETEKDEDVVFAELWLAGDESEPLEAFRRILAELQQVQKCHDKRGDIIAALRAELQQVKDALRRIAAWDEGPQVTGKFDEPVAARIARAALEGTDHG